MFSAGKRYNRRKRVVKNDSSQCGDARWWIDRPFFFFRTRAVRACQNGENSSAEDCVNVTLWSCWWRGVLFPLMERVFLWLPHTPYAAPSSLTCLKLVLMSRPVFSVLNTYTEGGVVVGLHSGSHLSPQCGCECYLIHMCTKKLKKLFEWSLYEISSLSTQYCLFLFTCLQVIVLFHKWIKHPLGGCRGANYEYIIALTLRDKATIVWIIYNAATWVMILMK